MTRERNVLRCPSDADPAHICLIACHVWDTIGAGAVDWQSALILRDGNAPLDVSPSPTTSGRTST